MTRGCDAGGLHCDAAPCAAAAGPRTVAGMADSFNPDQTAVELGGVWVILQKARETDGLVVVRVFPPRGSHVLARPEDDRLDILCVEMGEPFIGRPPVFVWEGEVEDD